MCASHAVQVLRRSGVCSLGLFHARTQVASARQPFAEQTGEAGLARSRVESPGYRPDRAMPGSHGGSRPASRSLSRAPAPEPAARRSAPSIARIDVTSSAVTRRGRAGRPQGRRFGQVDRSARGRRWRRRPTGRGARSRRAMKHPAQPAVGDDGEHEADRADAHGDQVAPGPGVDVLPDAAPGAGDLVDRLRAPSACAEPRLRAASVRATRLTVIDPSSPHRSRSTDEQPHLPRHRDRRHLRRRASTTAIRNGLARAAQTLRHLDWFEVTQVRGQIVDGAPQHFQVGMKVGFRLEDA